MSNLIIESTKSGDWMKRARDQYDREWEQVFCSEPEVLHLHHQQHAVDDIWNGVNRTAIASLSGVAATNAALAWLGGGAAGGAGMIGGQALISMAGPIGWAIGGVSVAGGVLLKAFANRDIAKKAEDATNTIICETERIKETDATVCSWNRETIKLSNELTKKLTAVRRKKNYSLFTEDDRQELVIVMNMTEVLSKKLGDTISRVKRNY